MRTKRQHQIDRAVAEVLALTAGHLLPQSVLIADATRLVTPSPSRAEVEFAIRYHDTDRRITGVMGTTEMKWKLSDEGTAWLAENS